MSGARWPSRRKVRRWRRVRRTIIAVWLAAHVLGLLALGFVGYVFVWIAMQMQAWGM